MKKLIPGIIIIALIILSCKEKKDSSTATVEEETETAMTTKNTEPFFKISLAQWSLHKMVMEDGADPLGFVGEAKALGIDAVEYVSQLYSKKLEELGYDALIVAMRTEQDKHDVKCLLIMVDGEGDLADPDEEVRNQAVEDHKKWVDAAAALGGHSIRVNTFGTNDPEEWIPAVKDGLTKLSEYAATKNINVLVENHGWMSSDAPKVVEAIQGVDMANCGTLPDFGNWCIKRTEGSRWGECEEEYPDYYDGIKQLMPYAKGVSAKSYNFDEEGNETKLDYVKMLQIVKDAGYTGYIGIEYEGSELGEKEGIEATRKLLLAAAAKVN